MKVLSDYIGLYVNETKTNNQIHREFTDRVNQVAYLKRHRDFIEENNFGFGDRAFHFMWKLLLEHVSKERGGTIRMLEIGVYMGQVISLWSTISKECDIESRITAISPFEGNIPNKQSLFNRIMQKFVPTWRKRSNEGNIYRRINYMEAISTLFKQFELDIKNVRFIKGFSNDQKIIESVKHEKFDIIYIDGDHSYEVALSDIKNYASTIVSGGYLVMDDAACNIPGGEDGSYWKGHQSVSDACKIIPELGFENVLNVGHNRIYKKH